MSTQHLSPHKPIIGILGGIGSGKSLVAKHLQSLGAALFNADSAAQQLLDQPNIIHQLTNCFSETILNENGTINRAALANITFNDKNQRDKLERIIHPLIRQQCDNFISDAQNNPDVVAIVLDIPLLAETDWHKDCDYLIFVKADKKIRLQRVAKQRQWPPDELQRRENIQMPLDKKLKLAHHVVANDSDETECLAQVRNLLTRLLHKVD